jgi:two-component system CheB/CheR fusion protein
VSGVASLNLFALLHTDLRAIVRAALRQAAETGTRVVHESFIVEAGDQTETINLIVEPLPDRIGEPLYVVAFQEVSRAASATGDAAAKADGSDSNNQTESLTRQLTETKVRLRSIEEELRAAHEELQSTNEEYLSVNEELQSTNEELETSKEELQSLNEELQTINAELNHRNDSLVRSNSDLANLLDSTSIATLFLDNDLRIRRFTPRLLEIFKVRDGDEGRPITDIVTHLTRDGLGGDVQQVLRTLAPVEREVTVENGLSYLMQVRAYRDVNNVIDGAVVTFVDISERKKHEQASALLAAIVESSEDAIVSHDLDGTVTSWNGGAEQLFGYSASEAIGQSLSLLLHEALPDDWPHMLAKLEMGEQIGHFDSTRTVRNGRSVDVSVKVSPLRDSGGRIVGASMVARDISERRRAEEKSALLLGELDHRVKNILAVVSAVVFQTLKTSSSPQAFAADINGRIGAIAKAHSLLTDSGLGEMSLRTIIETELAPYDHDGRNIAITGRGVALTPKAGLAVAMAIHELASNAAKYGALSTPLGRLSVDWKTTGNPGDHKLTLHWTEAAGPAVEMPKRRGFGTTLIERSLAHEFDAEVDREFDPAGLHCTIAMPLTEDVGRLQPGTMAGDVGE